MLVAGSRKCWLALDSRINSAVNMIGLSEIDSLIQESYEETNQTVGNHMMKQFAKEAWFDKDCATKRSQKFAWLRVWRREGGSFYLAEYRRASREFRQLCIIKKSQYAKRLAAEFCIARDSATF